MKIVETKRKVSWIAKLHSDLVYRWAHDGVNSFQSYGADEVLMHENSFRENTNFLALISEGLIRVYGPYLKLKFQIENDTIKSGETGIHIINEFSVTWSKKIVDSRQREFFSGKSKV